VEVVGGGLAVVLVVVTIALLVLDRQRPRRAPYPWLWLLPPGALIGVSLFFGVALYPGLPTEIPTHFDVHGVADHYAATTAFTAFFPVIIQTLLTAIIAVAAALSLRLPPRGDARAAVTTVQATLILATGVDLALLLLARPVWQGRTTLSTGTLIGAALAVAVGVAAVLAASLRATRPAPGDPESHWRGIFYIDRDNPSIFVPKRFGLGWTLNLGRPGGQALLAALIAVPVLTVAVGAFAA
jgi:uncharacterized membrane protein